MVLASSETRIADALGQISGVPVTAYGPDGAIDHARSGRIAARIAKAGIRNIIAAGNTGEFFSLSHDEAVQLYRSIAEAVGDNALVTAAVGRSLVEAKMMCEAAIAAGAGAIMVHWPADPFAGPSHKIDYFLNLAEHATIPVIAYLRADEPKLPDLVRLAEHENIVAIKYANTNLMLLAEAIRATRHCNPLWVCGLAEGWAPVFYALGARGFTSGLVNVFPRISLSVFEALDAGDFTNARMLIDEIAAFEQMRTLYNNGANVTVVKEALDLLGEPTGKVRLPGVVALSGAERTQLSQIVDRISQQAKAS